MTPKDMAKRSVKAQREKLGGQEAYNEHMRDIAKRKRPKKKK